MSQREYVRGRSEVLLGPEHWIFKAFYEYHTEKLKYRAVTCLSLKFWHDKFAI